MGGENVLYSQNGLGRAYYLRQYSAPAPAPPQRGGNVTSVKDVADAAVAPLRNEFIVARKPLT